MPEQISLEKLKLEVAIVESELSTLETKGTNASAVRARAHLINAKKESDRLRKQILAYYKELQAERKAAKEPKEEPAPEPVVEPTPEPINVVEPEMEASETDNPVIVVKKKRTRKTPKGRRERVKK